MKFNLNDNSLVGGSGNVVFNAGIAGKYEGAKIEATKRRADEPTNQPDYKLIFTDKNGAQLNVGFFYHKDNPMKDQAQNEAMAGYTIGRILSAAKAVVPNDFVFPDVSDKSVNEIIDILFNIIREHAEGAEVNIFASYGTKTKPSKYLSVRYFDYIEKPNTEKSRLSAKGDDMMERLVEDTPQDSSSANTNTGTGWGV